MFQKWQRKKDVTKEKQCWCKQEHLCTTNLSLKQLNKNDQL